MPVQVSYPGVYIQEEPSGVRTITGVSTSVALFIGMAGRGPMDTAVSLLSYADYERTYGSDTTVSETTDQVRQFFLNGGSQAYIIRIASGEQPAAADFQNEDGAVVLRITAAEAGRIGDSIRVEVNYATAQPESSFNLVVSRETITSSGATLLVDTETIGNLSMNSAEPRFVETAVAQGSRLIRAEVQPTAPAPFEGYSMSGRAESAPGILAALNAELGGAAGSMQVSVDNGPFAPVTVTGPLAALSDLQDAINTASSAVGGGTVTVQAEPVPGGTEEVLLIRSNAAGGRVRVQAGASNDLAGPMNLGTSNDGLEVDGHAARRPAPTGVFGSLGSLDSTSGTWLDRLSGFLRADPGDLPDLTLATGSRSDTATITGFTRPTFWETTPAAGTSLRNARGALELLAAQVALAGPHYVPAVQGYRLVLNPTYPGFAEQETLTPSTTGTYDIGNAGSGYLGRDPNVRRAPLGAFASPSNYVVGVAAGADGNLPTPADYSAAYVIASREIDIFNLLMLPRVLNDGSGNGQTDAQRAQLWGPASAFCLTERAFLIIDPPDAWTTAQSATSGPTGIANVRIGVVGDHAMVVWPRLRIPDPLGGPLRTIDPAGSVAGVAARIDGSRGVWKAPAGLEASVIGVRGVERRIADAENGLLNPQAINVVRQFPNGIVIWGSRTLAGFDNSGENDYKYVPVRRFALFLEESLYRGLQFAVFEPNDEPLWAQIRLTAGAFMNNLFRRGAFQGQKASDAYFVKCDAETTTQNDINLGIVNVIVGFAPLKPAEFVVVTIRQLAGQVQT
ncbi:phage tail sheath subtilisin-like domain-containing protein [Sphingomonas sp. BIUV-7]|uniref:Phage tail sheath subtilisin-like domain-containing protein n=1 Tax=Sphingomonas natans TaxID=3063330 RepID=A0ABT8YCQ2_9SPHN|nr:phage tail sheath subtilisin-like domain-containing protein [Sphingomonas sp. BIUV-7]MDO6416110.1 phage tail sheath subtilisin-like domain-containing protein [Sphingomonas sp. BIUV-7]